MNRITIKVPNKPEFWWDARVWSVLYEDWYSDEVFMPFSLN